MITLLTARKGLLLLLLSTAAISLSAQPPPQQRQATSSPAIVSGTISGKVVLQDGRPPDGVRILLRGTPTGPIDRVSADADGEFNAKVEAGKFYLIEADFPGYLRGRSAGARERGHVAGDRVSLTLQKGGVITGRVTTENDEPLVGLPISLRMTFAADRAVSTNSPFNVMTDDRGIYRFFGLAPGKYLVVANSPSGSYGYTTTGFERDLAVYYPGASREGAEEIAVEAGREVSGIDLRFRRQKGRSVLGSIEQKADSVCRATVELRDMPSNERFSSAPVRLEGEGCTFAFDGVPDGEYLLSATQNLEQGRMAASEVRAIIVKGADVAGIRLTLSPLGSIAGRVLFETLAVANRPLECKVSPIFAEQTRVGASMTRSRDDVRPGGITFRSSGGGVTSTGAFALSNLAPGTFAISISSADGRWFAKSITRLAAPRGVINVGRDGLILKADERVTDLTITLTEGAGAVSGGIENFVAEPRSQWSVFLVPKDAALAQDVLLRYSSAGISSSGAFLLRGVAPGHYWLVARKIVEERQALPGDAALLLDPVERAKLRREAEAGANPVEVKPCQTSQGYKLTLPAVSR